MPCCLRSKLQSQNICWKCLKYNIVSGLISMIWILNIVDTKNIFAWTIWCHANNATENRRHIRMRPNQRCYKLLPDAKIIKTPKWKESETKRNMDLNESMLITAKKDLRSREMNYLYWCTIQRRPHKIILENEGKSWKQSIWYDAIKGRPLTPNLKIDILY